jgi:hypothetical protein
MESQTIGHLVSQLAQVSRVQWAGVAAAVVSDRFYAEAFTLTMT